MPSSFRSVFPEGAIDNFDSPVSTGSGLQGNEREGYRSVFGQLDPSDFLWYLRPARLSPAGLF
jgi:hypothetical protein